MATCTKVESGKTKDGRRYVDYYYDDGTMEKRIDGPRAWRNNNPGNVVAGPGALGKDYGGLAIFPDVATGRKARKVLFGKGGKYYTYDSARHMLWGNFDKEGHQINDTGYAPKWDENGKVINNPDAYADFVRRYFQKHFKSKYNKDMDVEHIKIKEYTPEMLEVLGAAQEKWEGFTKGPREIQWTDRTGKPVSGQSGKSLPAGGAPSAPSGPHASRPPEPIRNALAPDTSLMGPASAFAVPYETASTVERNPIFPSGPVPPGSPLSLFQQRVLLAPSPAPFGEGSPRPSYRRGNYNFLMPSACESTQGHY